MNEIKPQTANVRENEALLKDGAEWLHFRDPHRVIIAESPEKVLPALHEIERLIRDNDWYAAGFLSYEAAPAFDPAFQTQPHSGFPCLWFGLYPAPHTVSLSQLAGTKEPVHWTPTLDRASYNAAIASIKASIAEGRTYQVNYTMRLQTDFSGDAWEFFLHLARNQNNQAAFVNTGRHAICSVSPELFFQLDGHQITCRPMKGTAKRGRTTAEDQAQAEWLKQSDKNRSENVMIVDMIRNDLGRIAKPGSVAVPQLFRTERYPTLWQMTSTVTAQTNASLAEIFTALFPCASITGAPRVSTMNIIAALENTPRKIYTGSIGYISPQRKAKFNVAIRTALIDRELEKAEYGVGGGIVWDSTSTDEYAEALLKAEVLTRRPVAFSLLETMLWTEQESFFLRQKHITRMLDSADYFDIPVSEEKLENYLEQLSSSFRTPQRVRLLLDQRGNLTHESSAFSFMDETRPLTTHLAKEPVNSNNVFLFHKTTRRDFYARARKGFESFDDALLYNEAGELTEFTTGNLVVEREGQLQTPPISCGVLPGTFRAHLLETGQVVEAIVTLGQLSQCTRLFRVNSVRRWQEVKIWSEAGALMG